jgi:epoxide hydrolase-like predicted phosphatase
LARRGLLVDSGGVLTTSVFDSFAAFCVTEGLAPDTVRDAFMHDPEGRRMLFELETGALTAETFAPAFGALLGLVDTERLVERMMAGSQADEAMLAAVRAFRARGVRTGLVSNSWGVDNYDRAAFPELFDAVVISAEEGIRKPDPEIYALGAQRLGLAPEECVFVDDLGGNLKPARAMGMATVRHTSAAETIAELEALLGVSVG